MALKPDRNQLDWDISRYINDAAGNAAGGIAVVVTNGSGHAMDGSLNVATYAANPSGRVIAGLLLGDLEVYPSKLQRNFYRDSNPVGSKVSLLTKGWVVTNMIYPGVTPAATDVAYLGQSGYITNVQANGAPVVGRFESTKDEDGYAKVSINIP